MFESLLKYFFLKSEKCCVFSGNGTDRLNGVWRQQLLPEGHNAATRNFMTEFEDQTAGVGSLLVWSGPFP
jgi:hypothetical protein